MSTAPHTAPTSPAARLTGRGEKLEAGPSRFIADPAALGLAGFGLSTMVLSFINARSRCTCSHGASSASTCGCA